MVKQGANPTPSEPIARVAAECFCGFDSSNSAAKARHLQGRAALDESDPVRGPSGQFSHSDATGLLPVHG